jgi:hypothetical protein
MNFLIISELRSALVKEFSEHLVSANHRNIQEILVPAPVSGEEVGSEVCIAQCSLGHFDNLPVPFHTGHLVDESGQLGKGGVRPLGDVHYVDHLAGSPWGQFQPTRWQTMQG